MLLQNFVEQFCPFLLDVLFYILNHSDNVALTSRSLSSDNVALTSRSLSSDNVVLTSR